MSRRAIAALIVAAALAAGGAVQAQGTAGAGAHSGDAWVDARMLDIGTYAATYRDAFVDELVRYHRAPRELVAELLARPGWTAGDVYLACSLALQSGQPCRAVADLRQRDPAQGWAAIAREVGIAPGSPAYLELKRGIVTAYDHWARPVTVDADLAPLYPGRPRSAPASERAPGPKAAGAANARPGG